MARLSTSALAEYRCGGGDQVATRFGSGEGATPRRCRVAKPGAHRVAGRMRQRTKPARRTPRVMSMAMSSSHQVGLWDHSASLVGISGAILHRSAVEAVAANPHRAGTIQDSWSSTGRPLTGISPPENTMEAMMVTTSIGRICSVDLATDDIARPRIAGTPAGAARGGC